MRQLALRWKQAWPSLPITLGALLAASVAIGGGILWWNQPETVSKASLSQTPDKANPNVNPGGLQPGSIHLTSLQQSTIGIEVEPVKLTTSTDVLQAPGQVVPDETKYAYITPRAAGVVRSVIAHEGQPVKAGDLLATIDSHDVAEARFALVAALQELDVNRSQADWQKRIYENTLSLLDRLKKGDTPEEIATRFEDKPVGTNRQQLITAYANQRLAKVTLARQQDLNNQGILPSKQVEMARAEYESAEATYKSLTEQMAFTAQLEHTKAQQALRKAETSSRVARALLRVYGLENDSDVPQITPDGKVIGVNPDGTLTSSYAQFKNKPRRLENHSVISDRPVSSYEILAPFDGIILDRMMIVPGVYVEMTNRIFTLADLSTVWVEVNVHENNYGLLDRSREASVLFRSPAYPGKTFHAEVIYRGDLVDPKSRTIKLMARAENPERLLKPGMFVDVDVSIPSDRKVSLVPTTALMTDDETSLVFVKTGPDRFARREVVSGSVHGPHTEILEGLKEGEEVVVRGGFKLKAESEIEQGNTINAPAVEARRTHPPTDARDRGLARPFEVAHATGDSR